MTNTLETLQIVDNFEEIKNLMNFKVGYYGVQIIDENDFYFVQLIKRKKDNEGQTKDARIIDHWFLKDAEDLMNKKDKIIELCEQNSARAYIHLNRRNYEKISLQMSKILIDCIIAKNYRESKNAFHSACGQYASENVKTWIIDIDLKLSIEEREAIETELIAIEPVGGKVIKWIPTRNGFHCITTPFRLDVWNKTHAKTDIHKDGPTVLYYNPNNFQVL